MLIKLFERSTPATKAADEIGLSYKTALKVFSTIENAIVQELAKGNGLLEGEIETGESYFGDGERGRGSVKKSIVFGILEGKGYISIIKDASIETLMRETVKKVRRGAIVYTGRWKPAAIQGYPPGSSGRNSLYRQVEGLRLLDVLWVQALSFDHQHKFKRGKVYKNGIEGFLSFAIG